MNPAASAGNPPVAALATAPGAAGVAVVRLSGEGALAIADRLCAGARVPPSALPGGSFRLYRLRDPRDGSAIDEALVLVFRAPHSYTGEDVAEFQTHGGRAAPTRVLDALLALGAAPAGPGEFTRRAFLSGRIGLDRAEGVRLANGEALSVDGVFCLRDAISLSALMPRLATEDGHIAVDRRMATNLNGVFAAGDCTGRPYQYAKAVGEGNVAAHSAVEYLAGLEK